MPKILNTYHTGKQTNKQLIIISTLVANRETGLLCPFFYTIAIKKGNLNHHHPAQPSNQPSIHPFRAYLDLFSCCTIRHSKTPAVVYCPSSVSPISFLVWPIPVALERLIIGYMGTRIHNHNMLNSTSMVERVSIKASFISLTSSPAPPIGSSLRNRSNSKKSSAFLTSTDG